MIHVAGLRIGVPPYIRQRCAWCGTVLVNENQDLLAFADGDHSVPTWEPGGLVAVEGGASFVIQSMGANVLADSCMGLNPDSTL